MSRAVRIWAKICVAALWRQIIKLSLSAAIIKSPHITITLNMTLMFLPGLFWIHFRRSSCRKRILFLNSSQTRSSLRIIDFSEHTTLIYIRCVTHRSDITVDCIDREI